MPLLESHRSDVTFGSLDINLDRPLLLPSGNCPAPPPLNESEPLISSEVTEESLALPCDGLLPLPEGHRSKVTLGPLDNHSDRPLLLPNGNCPVPLTDLSNPLADPSNSSDQTSNFVFGCATSDVPMTSRSINGANNGKQCLSTTNSKKQSITNLANARKHIATRNRLSASKTNPRQEVNCFTTRKRRITESDPAKEAMNEVQDNAPVTRPAPNASQQPAKTMSYAKILNATLKCDKVKIEYIAGNRNADFDNAIEVPVDVVRMGCLPYENTLYGYFVGRTLPFRQVSYHCEKMWNSYGLQKITTNGNGYFFFKFGCNQGMRRVLEEGPWIIQNVPIFINKWEAGLVLSKQQHNTVPLWVKLHHVPCELLTGKGLSYVASSLGKPIALDAYTSEMCNGGATHLKYARVLIEFNAEIEWKDKVGVVIPKLDGCGKVLHEIRVEYPWRPSRCSVCKLYGHESVKCLQIELEQSHRNTPATRVNSTAATNADLQPGHNRKQKATINKMQPTSATSHTSHFKPSLRTSAAGIVKPARITAEHTHYSTNTPHHQSPPSKTAPTTRAPATKTITLLKPKSKNPNPAEGNTPSTDHTPNQQRNPILSNTFQPLAELDVLESLATMDSPCLSSLTSRNGDSDLSKTGGLPPIL